MAESCPNIILVMTDHFRRDAITKKNTPHLMKLAESGVLFANAYCAAPLCGPARNALITGMYPSQNGVCGNQAEPIPTELRDDTFMNHLRSSGYITALIGKHHYIDRYGLDVDVREDNDEIKRYGFDHVFQVVDDGENGHNEDEYTTYLRNKGLLDVHREQLKKGGFRHPFPEEDYIDAFIGSRGCQFIREYDQKQPFYLNVSFVGPHPPLWHPGDLQSDPEQMAAPIGTADSKQARMKRAHYADKVHIIDRWIGELVRTVEERGLERDTVWIFTSDHGDNLGDFGIWDKRFFYEQSVGVPLILSGPGIPHGQRRNGMRVSKAMVSHLDLYPTILRLAQTSAVRNESRDGRDILSMLSEDREAFHREIFAELGTSAMIRTANWKLVFDPEQGGVQHLYNLAVDPSEQVNLAGAAGYEHVVNDLLQKLLGRYIRMRQYTHVKEEQRVQRIRIL
ncbi:MAG: betC 3 [Paenibacillaceae bacterium]|jgi:choline-sulfatase|nr:betC 3 [Paenibacillaceae bacterium]